MVLQIWSFSRAGSSETIERTYQPTRCHFPEHHTYILSRRVRRILETYSINIRPHFSEYLSNPTYRIFMQILPDEMKTKLSLRCSGPLIRCSFQRTERFTSLLPNAVSIWSDVPRRLTWIWTSRQYSTSGRHCVRCTVFLLTGHSGLGLAPRRPTWPPASVLYSKVLAL